MSINSTQSRRGHGVTDPFFIKWTYSPLLKREWAIFKYCEWGNTVLGSVLIFSSEIKWKSPFKISYTEHCINPDFLRSQLIWIYSVVFKKKRI